MLFRTFIYQIGLCKTGGLYVETGQMQLRLVAFDGQISLRRRFLERFKRDALRKHGLLGFVFLAGGVGLVGDVRCHLGVGPGISQFAYG